ncbi:hypothetical protein M422DRAFT_271164 [Sphaerobolus stellatus SS14]|uniref:SEC63 domain-containing protein n=1 Tax=Sphaerobolus stellatus (strain SS14) TaxID=990650 RepID=A0A0C9TEB4_SPHS4|nr:hypothetical protein M422DRAFT_271164 [Sphaerobolus stellatus SS14]
MTDLGRIAAKYYIHTASIEIFNKELKPVMSKADILGMLSISTEFDQVQLQENKVKELKDLMDEIIRCEVKGGTETSEGKVNILLQGYISKAHIEDFALVSDMAYVTQNGDRIIWGLFEIGLSRKWATVCSVLYSMSKAYVLYNLQRWADELSVAELASVSTAELGKFL